MKATLKINKEKIDIELTLEQVSKINRAAITYTDINTFEDACAYEGIDPVERKRNENRNTRPL